MAPLSGRNVPILSSHPLPIDMNSGARTRKKLILMIHDRDLLMLIMFIEYKRIGGYRGAGETESGTRAEDASAKNVANMRRHSNTPSAPTTWLGSAMAHVVRVLLRDIK